jgi:hypothetical protein
MGKKNRKEIIRFTEAVAGASLRNQEKRSAFLGIEEMIFRNELSILLNEKTAPLTIQPITLMKEQRVFSADMHFIKQNFDYIAGQIQQRLTRHNLYVEKDQIKHYLQNIDSLFRAALAKGENLSA